MAELMARGIDRNSEGEFLGYARNDKRVRRRERENSSATVGMTKKNENGAQRHPLCDSARTGYRSDVEGASSRRFCQQSAGLKLKYKFKFRSGMESSMEEFR